MLCLGQELIGVFSNGATVKATVVKIEPSLLFEEDEDCTLECILSEAGRTRIFSYRVTNGENPQIVSAGEVADLK